MWTCTASLVAIFQNDKTKKRRRHTLWNQSWFNDTLLRESLWKFALVNHCKYYQQTLAMGSVEAGRGKGNNSKIWHAAVLKVAVPRVPCDVRACRLFHSLPGQWCRSDRPACSNGQSYLAICSIAEQGGFGGLDEALASCAPLLPEEARLVEDNSNKFLR